MAEAKDRVGYYSRAWRRNTDKSSKERQRETENWKFVSGIDFGQWDSASLELLRQESRPPTQFNFIQGKVLTLAGSFLQNPLETKYESEVGTPEWGADVFNKLLAYNKDCTEWTYAKSQFLLAMLTYRGVMELYKDYTRSPLGDIGLRYVNPFQLSFDYRWKTTNIDDCKRVWVAQFMDVEEIMQKFKKKNDMITEAYQRIQELIDDPNDNTEAIDKLADRSPEFFDAMGQQYLVIQALELKKKSKDRLFDIRSQEFLPYMAPEVMKAMLSLEGNSQFLRILPDECTELNVFTICPALGYDLILEDGPHPLQIGGYPYVVASALNLHGEAQGVVDVLKDPQMTVNKRESTMTHWQSTAVNGTETVEEDAFSSDEEYNRYVLYKNAPGQTFKVTSGTNKDKKIALRERGTPPNDLVDSVNRSIGHMDRMWAPPAVQAGEGKSGESGTLFKEKKEQALVALEFINKTLAFVDHQLGSKFFECGRVVYGNSARQLKLPGGEVLKLNWPGLDGTKINDIAQIPRMAVRISQSQASISVKRERLDLYSQYGQVVTTPIMKAVLELMMIDVVPNLPEADKEEIKAVQMEYIQLLRKRTAAESSQLDQAIAAAQNPQQQMAPSGAPPATGPSPAGEHPAQGGGISAEGKPMTPGATTPVDVRAQNQLS